MYVILVHTSKTIGYNYIFSADFFWLDYPSLDLQGDRTKFSTGGR